MRKFLKRLRKGIRTSCLTAVLATCWQVGQLAPALATTVPVQFSGTVSPADTDISHLFFIYGTGYSSIGYPLGAVKLGDFLAGQTTPFSVLTIVSDSRTMWWYTAALYGDISGGEYNESINGVTLGITASEGDSWSTYFSSQDEATTFTHLLNDDPGQLPAQGWSWSGWEFDFDNGVEITDSRVLFDFTTASANGEIYIESEIVPEPLTLLLFGSGGIYVLCRRRQKD